MTDAEAPSRAVVAGRSCGTCGLCCKLLAIAALNKDENRWCPHFRQGSGCSIHGSHPTECAAFYCGFMRRGELGEEWRPTKSRFVIYWMREGKRMVVHVDPSFPGAWRKEPYYAALKSWSEQIAKGFEVVVRVQDRMIVVLPNKDVDLGRVEAGDIVTISQMATPTGVDYFAQRVPRAEVTDEMRARAKPIAPGEGSV